MKGVFPFDEKWTPNSFCKTTSQKHHTNFLAAQITDSTVVCSADFSGLQQRKQAKNYWPFLKGIHWWPVDSPHKVPVMWKAFPYYDVTMRVDWHGINLETHHLTALKHYFTLFVPNCFQKQKNVFAFPFIHRHRHGVSSIFPNPRQGHFYPPATATDTPVKFQSNLISSTKQSRHRLNFARSCDKTSYCSNNTTNE